MPIHRGRRTAAAGLLLLTLVTAGCGRHAIPPDGGAGSGTTDAGSGATPVALATAEPTPTTPTPAPSAAPLATPDLAAISRLLDDVDADLGADATASNDEGSPQ